jgi:CRISPR-associated protein Cas6
VFWKEDTGGKKEFVVPDDVVDISYKLECKTLPIDHAHSLSTAIQEALPWFVEEAQAGLHLIHVAESGNGWHRPEDPENEILCLSRRTRLTLRVPKHRINDAHALSDVSMEIAGHGLTVKEGAVKSLVALPTLFSRYVETEEGTDEDSFLVDMARTLEQKGIPVSKLMAGRVHRFRLGEQNRFTRSLMVADLTPDQSVKLQQQGIGESQKYGFGLFIPQKGIKAVNAED